MDIGRLNLSQLLGHLGIPTAAVKKAFGTAAAGVNLGAALQKPSTSTAALANQQAVMVARNPVVAEEVAITEMPATLKPVKTAAAEKKEGGREVDKEDEEDCKGFSGELLEDMSAGEREGGEGGGAGAGGEGAGAGGAGAGAFGGGFGAGAGARGGADQGVIEDQLKDLLKNLDPNKSIQDQKNQYCNHPAFQTEKAQAQLDQFIFDHLKSGETDLQRKVKMHVDKRTEEAVCAALQNEMKKKGASTDLQNQVGKTFSQYFALVSTETTNAPDEIKFMDEQVSSLPGVKGEELPVSFRRQLQHQVGLSMRKLDTSDDRAQFLVCNTAIRLTRAITLLFKDFETVIPRLEKQGLSKPALYAKE